MANERPMVPGHTVQLVGGAADGDTFFLCDERIDVEAFDGMVTRPVEARDGVRRVYANVTFLGRDPETGETKGVTLQMRTVILPALAKGLRTLYASTPIQFREVESDDGDLGGAAGS